MNIVRQTKLLLLTPYVKYIAKIICINTRRSKAAGLCSLCRARRSESPNTIHTVSQKWLIFPVHQSLEIFTVVFQAKVTKLTHSFVDLTLVAMPVLRDGVTIQRLKILSQNDDGQFLLILIKAVYINEFIQLRKNTCKNQSKFSFI